MEPGQRWVQLLDFLVHIELGPLSDAAVGWSYVEQLANELEFSLARATYLLEESGLVAEVRDDLDRSLDLAQEEFTAAARVYGTKGTEKHLPDVLFGVGDQLNRIKHAMEDEDAGFPTVLSEDPDMRLLQTYQLRGFDARADEYEEQVVGVLELATAYVRRYMTWPSAAGPPGDPSADLGAFGVPELPR